jgi:hypothetical protein
MAKIATVSFGLIISISPRSPAKREVARLEPDCRGDPACAPMSQLIF